MRIEPTTTSTRQWTGSHGNRALCIHIIGPTATNAMLMSPSKG